MEVSCQGVVLVCLNHRGLEVIVDSSLCGCPKLPSKVRLLSEGFNSQVQGKSLVLTVHVSEESGSVGRSKRSVLSNGSPWVERSVSAGKVDIGLNWLNGDVEGGNSHKRRIGLQPFYREIVDWLVANVGLELNLEDEAVLSSSNSGCNILSEVINGEIGLNESSGSSSITREHSVFGSGRWKSINSESVGRDGVVRSKERRDNSVVQSLGSVSGNNKGIEG
jgi:hypothetical protein